MWKNFYIITKYLIDCRTRMKELEDSLDHMNIIIAPINSSGAVAYNYIIHLRESRNLSPSGYYVLNVNADCEWKRNTKLCI